MFNTNSTYIIAELSANHNQDIQVAIDTIRMAKKVGANAIKLQTYTPDTMTIDCKSELFQINHGTLWDGETLYDLYKKAYTPWEWHAKLFEVAKEEGIHCFSSPFDKTAVDFLEDFDPPAYKIASFEITDIPLITYVAKKGKPIIISTGIASYQEIEEAVAACRNEGNDNIALLKCTSAYPAPYNEANLATIPDLQEKFGVISGLSDHTEGFVLPTIAVALGAKIIEKHFILDKSIGGPDAKFSLDPYSFEQMVKNVRISELAIGRVNYELGELSIKNRKFARSLFIVKDMKKNQVFTEENVRSIRPSFGLSPKYIDDIIGKRATQDIEPGTPLSWKLVW